MSDLSDSMGSNEAVPRVVSTTATPHQNSAGYSVFVGSIYVFNLMLGAGLLALPKAFVDVGWVLGLVSLAVLALMSYITVTFVVEAQAIHNAILFHKKPVNETTQLITEKAGDDVCMYEIRQKTELGELSKMFFHRSGTILYYICICLYLCGGMAIYAAAISKSLTSVVCDDPDCFSSFGNGSVSEKCIRFPELTVVHMYRIMLAVFVVTVCPFVFFTMTSAKFLQISTMAYRWFSLLAMVVLAIIRIANGKGNRTPRLGNAEKLPSFFGTALYSFMCQYSIPAVVTPMKDKKRLTSTMGVNFIGVVVLYTMINMTAIYAFQDGHVQDLYTLNFGHPAFFKYVLELFPVFTLGASFPILAIVLRENLKTLFLVRPEADYHFAVRRLLFPVVVVVPPLAIAYATHDVGDLVSYTGAYGGAVIQYVVPAALVYCARKRARAEFGVYNNKYASPFYHTTWVVLVLLWYLVTFVFVTYYKVISGGK